MGLLDFWARIRWPTEAGIRPTRDSLILTAASLLGVHCLELSKRICTWQSAFRAASATCSGVP
jgi:hypothetical protein